MSTRPKAPFVRGRALEFNQVGPSEPESAPEKDKPESTPDNCVPPVPSCTVGSRERERLLMAELSRKETELQDMRTRFGQLEDVVNRLAQQRIPAVIQPSSFEVERPIAPAAHVEAKLTAPPASRPLSAPTPGGQKRSAVAVRPSSAPPVSNPRVSQSSKFSVNEVPNASSGNLGEWNGAAKPTSLASRNMRK